MWELSLKDHQFRWPDTAWVGISGPSGCGKTRLLTHLACHSGGQLRRQGQNLLQRRPALRGIGWATQGAALWPAQRVGQQVRALAARHQRRDWPQLAEALKLTPLLDKSTALLSGGERQRVALLCALLCAKNLLLLDEPVSALDQDAAADVLTAVREAARAAPARRDTGQSPVAGYCRQLRLLLFLADADTARYRQRPGRVCRSVSRPGRGPLARAVERGRKTADRRRPGG